MNDSIIPSNINPIKEDDVYRTGLKNLIYQLQLRLDLACKVCGSNDIAMSGEEGIDYGGETGYQSGTFSFGCNSCKQNDTYIWGL